MRTLLPRLLPFFLLPFSFCLPLLAQPTQPTTQPTLRLIPTPRHVTITEGRFPLSPAVPVVLKSEDPADRLPAQQIASESLASLDIPLAVTAAVPGTRTITLIRRSIDLPAEAIAEGYRLTITPQEIRVEASAAPGLFYGAQTLRQLIRANTDLADHSLPCLTIVDWPLLRYRGWQDDISRGPIPTLDYLKSEIRRMSEVKQNLFTLYTEHVFKLKKHPAIAPPDGITAEEIADLAAYARLHHVELVGNFQSFGHFANILKLPRYASIGNGWALKPANEDAYAFLADVYSEIAPAYPSNLFCISCDEVGGFTDPDDLALINRLGPGGFYAYHINRVVELLRPHNKTPMMWGDIALERPDDIAKLSKDIIVLPWEYNDRGSFEKWVKPYADRGYRFIVCPGANNWSRLWPDLTNAIPNIADFTRDGHRFHTLGQLNTTWRDTGESLFGPNYYPLLWGAENAWSPITDATPSARESRLTNFNNAYDGVFHALPGNAIATANQTLGAKLKSNPLTHHLMDSTFWTSPATAAQEDPTSEHANQLATDAATVLDAASTALRNAKHNKDTLHHLIFAARRFDHMAQSVLTVNYALKPRAVSNPGRSIAQLDALVTSAKSLRASYIVLWTSENRSWWLDKNLEKYDALIRSLQVLPNSATIRPAKSEFTGTVEVELASLSMGAPVRYTLDNSDPTPDSHLYANPISLTKSTTVKARAFFPDGSAGPVATKTYTALRLPARLSTALTPYEDNILNRAFDGLDDTFFWGTGPIDANRGLVIHLDTPAAYHHIKVTTGHPTLNRDHLQTGVIEIQSPDSTTWEKVADFRNGAAEADLPNKPIKNIKVRTTEPQKEWLIIREVELE